MLVKKKHDIGLFGANSVNPKSWYQLRQVGEERFAKTNVVLHGKRSSVCEDQHTF